MRVRVNTLIGVIVVVLLGWRVKKIVLYAQNDAILCVGSVKPT